MSVTIQFPFNTPTNYTYNTDEIEISGGLVKLKLTEQTINFVEDFADDTGFIYDNTKSEFVGGSVQQKDQRPSNSILASSFDTDLNLNWAVDTFGSLVGTANGSPSIVNGKLSCQSGSNGVYWGSQDIGNLSGNWVAKFKYTPNYSDGPTNNSNIFSISQSSGGDDDIIIFHSPSGDSLRITANALSAVTYGVWQPIAGQEYIFEIFCVSNVVSIYVDGTQIGTGKTISPIQGTDSTRVWLGAYQTIYNYANALFDDFIMYSSASQDESYTFPTTVYSETNVTLPELEHIGQGEILSFNTMTTVETGSPRYTIQIGRSGDYLYYNGVMWAISDGSYSQSNDITTFNNNLSSLNVLGELYGQFKITFSDSNDQSLVSNLDAEVTENGDYYTNSYLEVNTIIRADSLISMLEDSTKLGSDEVKYILIQNSNYLWFDSNVMSFVASNGTYSESNTVAELQAVLPAFNEQEYDYSLRIFLHSDDGSTTPELDTVTLSYDVAGEQPDSISLCEVVFDIFQTDADPDTQSITIKLLNDPVKYKNNIVIRREVYEEIPNQTTGRISVKLVETVNMELDKKGVEQVYLVTIGNITYKINVPNQSLAYFWDLIVS